MPKSKKINYEIVWSLTDSDDIDTLKRVEMEIKAVDARRAMNKFFTDMRNEYGYERGDLLIHSVVPENF